MLISVIARSKTSSPVIASIAKQSVGLRAEDFKHPCINPTDWFNETPIRTSQ
jgi:hypothetical protein